MKQDLRWHNKNEDWASICVRNNMTNENCVRFTLSDNTNVIVKKVADNKYDFELRLPNGSRKTFIWSDTEDDEFFDRKGNMDKIITEAIKQFIVIIISVM